MIIISSWKVVIRKRFKQIFKSLWKYSVSYTHLDVYKRQVLASQIMSNVPAALLLSGFTDNYRALIVGTNIGGLGTLIASMASLISFKYIAKKNRNLRGKYLGIFTASNIIFMIFMLILYFFLR